MKTTPSALLSERQQWLLEDDSVHVVRNATGGYDVVLRLDGSYTDRADAVAVVSRLQDAVHSATRRAVYAAEQTAAAQARMDAL